MSLISWTDLAEGFLFCTDLCVYVCVCTGRTWICVHVYRCMFLHV